VYDSDLKIDGYFVIPEKSLKDHEILWNGAYYTRRHHRQRGIKGKIMLKIDSHQPKQNGSKGY
jgi:hypothetical protein